MPISRMDLADFGSPDAIAQGILERVPDLAVPVPIEDLARQLDIIDIMPLETEGFEGGLLTDENKAEGIILVNENNARQRCRFTVGHELGHFLSPWHKPATPDGFLCSAEDMRRAFAPEADRAARMEVEANRFAAHILMPAREFRADIRHRQGADIEHIIGLARRYDTSKEATSRRYIELHDEPCAAVISHRGRVLRFYRAREFPYTDVRSGTALPARSLSARPNIPEGIVTDWQEADAALWLPSERGRRLPALYEQVLAQRDGYRLTLLAIDDATAEHEEEELGESWTARFRK